LILEFYDGSAASTAHLIGGEVVNASHLYGALAGAVYALIPERAKHGISNNAA